MENQSQCFWWDGPTNTNSCPVEWTEAKHRGPALQRLDSLMGCGLTMTKVCLLFIEDIGLRNQVCSLLRGCHTP